MIVRMDQMNRVHVRRDDVWHNNSNVETETVHPFHTFVTVGISIEGNFHCDFFVNRRG